MTIRKLLLFSAAGVVALVATAIIVWWFAIREDAELATSPPEIPTNLIQATSEPTQAGDPTAAPSGSLTFRIVPAESEAAYFVGQKLVELPLPDTVKGTTNAIEGTFTLTPDGTALATEVQSQFTVDLTTLSSGDSRRDNRVQDALATSQFPVVTFVLASATGYDPAIAEGEEQAILLTGMLDLHGVQREVTWEVLALREGNVLSALATTTFDFADFGITPPNIAGFVSVEDEVTLQMQLIAELV